MVKKRYSIILCDKQIKKFDKVIKGHFESRSHALRFVIEDYLKKRGD